MIFLRPPLFTLVILFCNGLLGQSNIAEIAELPAEIKETSGLLFYNDNLITHNDSGNAPLLYEIDRHTGTILRVVRVKNAINSDWEDITQDDDYIYVGDFGNNNGDREDLHVLKISKQAYNSSNEVDAEQINFRYADQESFLPTTNSDYDAEAIYAKGDYLVILTKQWQQMGTVAYKIPKTPGDYVIAPFDTYQIDGLVTGASYNAFKNELYLVGYSKFLNPFFVSVFGLQADSIFNNEVIKTTLNIEPAQVEAVSVVSENEVYLSSEELINEPLINTKSRLFKFTLDENEDVEEETEEPEEANEESIPNKKENTNALILYKEFKSPYLNYSLTTDKPLIGMGVFNASGVLITYIPLEQLSGNSLDISSYTNAIYYLSFFLVDGVIAAPFIKD